MFLCFFTKHSRDTTVSSTWNLYQVKTSAYIGLFKIPPTYTDINDSYEEESENHEQNRMSMDKRKTFGPEQTE